MKISIVRRLAVSKLKDTRKAKGKCVQCGLEAEDVRSQCRSIELDMNKCIMESREDCAQIVSLKIERDKTEQK